MRALRIAITLLVTVFLLTYVVDGRQALRTISGLSLGWAVATMSIVTLDRFWTAYKWRLLLLVRGSTLGLLESVQIYCASMVWGTALPSTVGADAIRATIVARRGLAAPLDVIASILIERGVGFVVALLWAVGGLILLENLLPNSHVFRQAFWPVTLALLVATGTLLASLHRPFFDKLISWMPRKLAEHRASRVIDRLHRAYSDLGASPRTMVAFTLLTVLQPITGVGITWGAAMALDVHAPMATLLAAVPLGFVAARFPISLDGIGVYESIFIGIMALSGVSPADSLAIAVVGRVLQFLAWLPWWFAFVFKAGSVKRPIREHPAHDTP
jgi:uncharacterized membrane protein YbhN (UPF0104 family)